MERNSDALNVTTGVRCLAEALQKEEAWKISGFEALTEPLYIFFALGATPTIAAGDYLKLTAGPHAGKCAEVVWLGVFDWPRVQTQAVANVCPEPAGVFA